MTTLSRVLLLSMAMIWLGWWVIMGPEFYMHFPKPESFDPKIIGGGLVFAAPFWIPAIVPHRYVRSLRTARWLGMAGAAFLAYQSGLTVIQRLSLAASGGAYVPSLIVIGVALAAAAAFGFGVLLWPTIAARQARKT
jgi:hypothetical protein